MEENLKSIESQCGTSPVDVSFKEIGSDPNYVFLNDPNFATVVLYDQDGNIINVNSAKEMFDATLNNLPVDVAIFSAAVSDWKIKNFKNKKIKKNNDINLTLERNIDILSHVSNHNSLRPKMVIGFAAETDNLIENSKKKLNDKNCDWIIANDVSDVSIGFESDFNEVTIFYKNKKFEKISKMKKSLLSDNIVERIILELN